MSRAKLFVVNVQVTLTRGEGESISDVDEAGLAEDLVTEIEAIDALYVSNTTATTDIRFDIEAAVIQDTDRQKWAQDRGYGKKP